MFTPIEKSNLPASWQSTDGYNKFYWNVPGEYTFMSKPTPKYNVFEFTLNRACDQAYSIVNGYLFTWERSKYDSSHVLVNY